LCIIENVTVYSKSRIVCRQCCFTFKQWQIPRRPFSR